jgi:hypothetical protein
MRKLRRTELQGLLKNNICDIFFLRRRPERAPGRPAFRQMLCTNSVEILRSENGIRHLNWRQAGPKQVNEAIHNLVVTWDIFMQDYRNVSMEYCYLVKSFPADDSFWEYYNNVLYPMSPGEKLRYQDVENQIPEPNGQN